MIWPTKKSASAFLIDLLLYSRGLNNDEIEQNNSNFSITWTFPRLFDFELSKNYLRACSLRQCHDFRRGRSFICMPRDFLTHA